MSSASSRGYVRGGVLVALLLGSLFPPVAGMSLVMVGAAGALVILAWDFARTLRIPTATVFAAVMLVGLASATLIAPVVGLYGADKLNRLLTLTLLTAAAAGLVLTRSHLERLGWVWFAVAVVLAATATTGLASTGRAAGLDENNPIWLGRAIATGLVVVVWLMWTHRLRLLVGLPAAAVLGSGLIATGSRGPALGLLVGALAVIATTPGRKYQRPLTLLLSVASVVGLVVYLSTGGQAGPLLESGREISGSARTTFWDRSLDVIWANPLGVGFGGWQWEAGASARYPHNLFLEVLAEAGWIYGLIVLVVTGVVLVRLLRLARGGDALMALPLAMLVAEVIAVSVSGDVNGRTFWFLLALGWGLTSRSGEDRTALSGHTGVWAVAAVASRHTDAAVDPLA